MASTAKGTSDLRLTDRIMRLVENLSDEKKNSLLELLIEWQQKENRHHPRISCNFPVDYADQKRVYHDFIQDLSKGGLFIETREPLNIGQTVALTFSLPKSNTHFKMAGRIVRSETGGFAIQFDTQLSNYQAEAIMKNFNIK
jgi:hypothetical protein